jgi:hypothetical protein
VHGRFAYIDDRLTHELIYWQYSKQLHCTILPFSFLPNVAFAFVVPRGQLCMVSCGQLRSARVSNIDCSEMRPRRNFCWSVDDSRPIRGTRLTSAQVTIAQFCSITDAILFVAVSFPCCKLTLLEHWVFNCAIISALRGQIWMNNCQKVYQHEFIFRDKLSVMLFFKVDFMSGVVWISWPLRKIYCLNKWTWFNHASINWAQYGYFAWELGLFQLVTEFLWEDQQVVRVDWRSKNLKTHTTDYQIIRMSIGIQTVFSNPIKFGWNGHVSDKILSDWYLFGSFD